MIARTYRPDCEEDVAAQHWKNRIVGHADVAPADLLANPANFRKHPKHQAEALEGALGELGWLQQVVVNKRSGHLIDGHLRVSLALKRKEPTLPVVYVDLSEAEERLALATFDPITALAETDRDMLESLLRDVSTGDAGIQSMLDRLAQDAGLVPPTDPRAEWQGMPEFEQEDLSAFRSIVVHCGSQTDLDAFESLIGQRITDKTKSIWHPKRDYDPPKAYVYHDES